MLVGPKGQTDRQTISVIELSWTAKNAFHNTCGLLAIHAITCHLYFVCEGLYWQEQQQVSSDFSQFQVALECISVLRLSECGWRSLGLCTSLFKHLNRDTYILWQAADDGS